MGVEILVQHLTSILAKVSPLSSGVEESRPEDHDGLASGLLQLHLDCIKFPIDDVDHSVNLFGCDGSGSGLLTEQIHHMSRELFAALQNRFCLERNLIVRPLEVIWKDL